MMCRRYVEEMCGDTWRSYMEEMWRRYVEIPGGDVEGIHEGNVERYMEEMWRRFLTSCTVYVLAPQGRKILQVSQRFC